MPLGGAEGLWLEKGESGVAARFTGCSAEAKGIIGRGRSERPARKGREDRQALDRVGKQVKTLLLLRYPLRNKKHMRTGSPLGAPQHLA